jgi:hypothetical protein
VLYEALAGVLPYAGAGNATPLELLQIIREAEVIPLRHLRPDASRSLETLLHHALVKDREKRLASMREFTAELSRIALEPPPGAPVIELEWNDERRGTVRTMTSVRRSKTNR